VQERQELAIHLKGALNNMLCTETIYRARAIVYVHLFVAGGGGAEGHKAAGG